jgi:copper chaperone
MTPSSSSASPRVYAVAGMTCEHCVMSVTEEVAELPGVDGVSVDLAAGQLKVSGQVSDDAVKAAVAEAGYEVVS